jgi:hypothetical protein
MICYTEMPIHHFVIPVAFHSYAVIRADIEGYISDNTISKIKRTKEQTMIYKTLHRKLKIE